VLAQTSPAGASPKVLKAAVRDTALHQRPSAKKARLQPAQPEPNQLMDRAAVSLGSTGGTPADPIDPDAPQRRPREAVSFVSASADGAALPARGPSLGERVSSWFGRTRAPSTRPAATALSRLAVDLQPKATGFEYRWIDGKLQVQRAADK
jgi:hypothetical protein